MNKGKASHIQCAALPYRRLANAAIEVMLITSRDTGRWVIPKGWHGAGLAAQDSAEREAREEGGLVGRMGERPIGHYRYKKRLDPTDRGGLLGRRLHARGRAAAQVMAGAQGTAHPVVHVAGGCRRREGAGARAP